MPRLGSDFKVCGRNCKGRQIGYEWSAIKTPPDTPLQDMEHRLKEAICLYSHLEPFMKTLVNQTHGNFLHFSGTEGHQRIYPVLARHRKLPNGDEELNGCVKYDPRIRPWFLAASTRPKDIVFVIDVSGSMLQPSEGSSGPSRWDFTSKAVMAMLDTLTSSDFVNIVTFSDSAQRLGTKSSLLQGTEKNMNILKEEVAKQIPNGLTNFNSGFQEAFDILTKACDEDPETQTCSNCNKVIMFLTDGRDTSAPDFKSISAPTMLRKIERYQQKLEDATGSRAMIFTFSMGEDSDGSIPRQISCANNGSWSFIGRNEDPLTAMASYYHFLTNSESYDRPVWADEYWNAGGQGYVTSVSKAVFSRGSGKLHGIFLGVVGHTVLLKDLEIPGVPYEDVLKVLRQRSLRCEVVRQSKCQLQAHRNAFANKAVCADNISYNRTGYPRGDWKDVSPCYRGFRSTFYKLFSEATTWDKARAICKRDGGQLATIRSLSELAFVAAVSNPDGSWIGARWNIDNIRWEWIDEKLNHSNLIPGTEYWAVGEPNNFQNQVEDCVEIDRRGANGNLNDENCYKRLSFICQYSTQESCKDVVSVPRRRGYFSMPPLSRCVHEENSLARARPLAMSKDFTFEEVLCPLGKPIDNFTAICCPDCKPLKNKRNRMF
eukprot:g5670.t1